MSELFKCLCFMERLSLSTRDHNASGVDAGCFMVYNCFQFHSFITNNKCRLLLRALSFTYCTSELYSVLTLLKTGFVQWSDANRLNSDRLKCGLLNNAGRVHCSGWSQKLRPTG